MRMPGTRAGEIEFLHADGLAERLCEEAGDGVRINRQESTQLFSQLYEEQVLKGTPLGDSGFSEEYLKAEIDKVIKVQDLRSMDDYLSLERVGRSAPMDSGQREQLWALVEEWDAAKAEHGVIDVCDLIPRGLAHARRLSEATYSAAIVDEAQDMTLAALQLVRATVNAPEHGRDGPDGLMLLGDAAQRIYEGGLSLDRAAVDIEGRSIPLGENYRNTAEIIDAATAVAGDVRVEDFDQSFVRGEAVGAVERNGPKPQLVGATGLDAQLDYVLARIKELASADEGYSYGDIGILVRRNADVRALLKRLRRQGYRAKDLKGFEGKTTNSIKVGTYYRGKGLEFKAVFLPQLSRDKFPLPLPRGTNPREAAEDRDRQTALLFVAMTRARDLLFVLHDGQPSEPVAAAADYFDVVDAGRR